LALTDPAVVQVSYELQEYMLNSGPLQSREPMNTQQRKAGIAICAAMRWELRPVLRALPRVRLVRATRPRTWLAPGSPAPVVVFQTGIGMDAAAEAMRSIIRDFSPAAIVNTGCAGSLSHSLIVGAVVCGSALIDSDDADLRHYATHPALTAALRQASVSAGFQPLTRPILTSRAPLITPESKAQAFARFGAAAVEMEGSAIARVVSEAGGDLASVRVILDDAAATLPTPPAAGKTMFDFGRDMASPVLSAEELTGFSVTAHHVSIVDEVLGKVFRSFLRAKV
jgi:adenosylhomocysteine nucleosidase